MGKLLLLEFLIESIKPIGAERMTMTETIASKCSSPIDTECVFHRDLPLTGVVNLMTDA
jgi:hypothetical protein